MKFKIIPNEQTPKVNLTEAIDINKDHKLFEKFLSFARRQRNCTGLAANQVSLDGERVMKSFFAIKTDRFWDMIINPEILKYSDEKEVKIEGCLTWLGKQLTVERFNYIDVCYYNLQGTYIERSISGFEAQVWQHEYDHLMGVEEKFV